MPAPDGGSAPRLLRVSRHRLYELLADQLLAHVEREGLLPGDRLPAERLLAEQFGVSRASVRQALVALEVKGVVEVRHGGGVFLADTTRPYPPTGLWHRAERLDDVLAVREALAVKSAELAAEHCRDEDRRLMERALQQMDDDITQGGSGAEADAAFHRTVALASRNPLLLELMDALSDRIRESRVAGPSEPGRPPVSLAAHRDIAAAIVRGDAPAAADAMRAHHAVLAAVDVDSARRPAASPPVGPAGRTVTPPRSGRRTPASG